MSALPLSRPGTVLPRPIRGLHGRCLHRQRFPVRNATSDHSINVNGDIRKVFKYVADVTNRPNWDPATSQVTPANSQATVGVGAKFDSVQVPMPAVKIPIRYAVSEYEFPKKLVVWGKAEGFMTSTTFMFMEHPARPNHTIVRQIYDINMRDWKSMIPMLEIQLAKKEASAFQNLERTLNASNTPLADIVLASEDLKHGYKPKHPVAARQPSSGWNMAAVSGNLGSMFSGMFAKQPIDTQTAEASPGPSSSSYSSQGVRQPSTSMSDVLGYYKLLGLEASSTTTTDTIKAAFRKAAMRVHPDKVAASDEKAQQAAQIQFQILQAAYETLKDPEKRVMYDRGQAHGSSEDD